MTRKSLTLSALAASLLLFPLSAFARGGGGAALGMMFVYFVNIGIVLGVIMGIAFRNARWAPYLVYSAPVFFALAKWVLPHWSTWKTVASTAALVILPLVSAIALLARSERPTPESRTMQRLQSALVWGCATYVFWMICSLFNQTMFGLFPFSLFKLFDSTSQQSAFAPFVLPPLLISFAVAVITVGVSIAFWSVKDKRIAPLIFNVALLLSFIVSCEAYKEILVRRDLQGRNPQCYSSHSFLESLGAAGSFYRMSHASFDEAGTHYLWSYAERRFVAVGTSVCHAN